MTFSAKRNPSMLSQFATLDKQSDSLDVGRILGGYNEDTDKQGLRNGRRRRRRKERTGHNRVKPEASITPSGVKQPAGHTKPSHTALCRAGSANPGVPAVHLAFPSPTQAEAASQCEAAMRGHGFP